MDNELKKQLEGEENGTLEDTSASSKVELNNSPVPTQEELEDAHSMIESDEPTITENVEENVTPENEIPSAEKLFTQSQVNDLVGKTRMETREQTYRAIYGRYGVDDEAGMDELIGNAQRFESMRDEYDEARKGWETADLARNNELAEIKEHVALLESGIDKARFDDAKAIIKSKGLEVTVDSINNELATHPEWKGAVNEEKVNPNFRKDLNATPQKEAQAQESTIKVLGNESGLDTGGMSEEEFALKNLFKV